MEVKKEDEEMAKMATLADQNAEPVGMETVEIENNDSTSAPPQKLRTAEDLFGSDDDTDDDMDAGSAAAGGGAALVGRRVRVWWEGEDCWYSGTIDRYIAPSHTSKRRASTGGRHEVKYDDGDRRKYDFEGDLTLTWEFEGAAAAAAAPAVAAAPGGGGGGRGGEGGGGAGGGGGRG